MAVRRIILRTVIALAATAAGVLGYLDVHGDFQRWSDNSALDGACDGLLDRDVVRGVLGAGEVEVKGENEDYARAYRGLIAGCRVEVDGGGSAEVRIRDTAYVEENVASLYKSSVSDVLSVPVGYGWSGLFGADPEEPKGYLGSQGDEDVTVSLVLDCAESSKLKSLSVTVETSLRDATLDDPANRPEYARIATSTAANASKKQGCEAKLGKPVRRLGLPVTEDEYQPLRTADGTCSGIFTAKEVTLATETDRGDAPYEVCRLSDADTSTRYFLKGQFGPYAQEAYADYQEFDYGRSRPSPDIAARQRAAGGPVSWTSAKCPDGPALFTLEVAADEDKDRKETASTPGPAYERAALRAFAERAAKAHGCSAPATL
jgi:hypothetical protein